MIPTSSPLRTFSLIALLAGAGCATTPQTMRSSTLTPASEGTVKVEPGADHALNLSLKVRHLAPAAKVWPEATTYVVWVQPRNAPPQNVGVLTMDSNLEGGLEATTPHHRFQVLVTPEASGQVSAPSHDAVFTSDVDRDD
jgi:hypothetical protein